MKVVQKKAIRRLLEGKYLLALLPMGGAVASWLVRSSPDRAVQVRALTGDIGFVLGQDTILTVPPSTQVYKWVPGNLMLG